MPPTVTYRYLPLPTVTYRCLQVCRDMDWFQTDFTQREFSLTFLWARMRVIDETPAKSRVKLTQLSFEDFLEALVRVACIKTLPTQEEIFDAGHADAGAFMLALQVTTVTYRYLPLPTVTYRYRRTGG